MAIGETGTPEHLALKRALDGLYEAFGRSGLVPRLASDEPRGYDAAWFARQSPSAIPAEVMNEFLLELGSSVGDGDDIRYFLPRLFELMVEGDAWLDAEIVVSKLALGDWSRWPDAERAAVRTFLAALLDRAIAGWFIGGLDVVRGLAAAGEPLGPYLARFEARRDLAGVRAIRDLAQSEADRVLSDRERGSLPELRAWLRLPARLAWTDERLAELGTGPELDEARYALQVLL